MIEFFALVLACLLLGVWLVVPSGPAVDESRCVFDDVRQGLVKCGGCAACLRADGSLPCEK